MTTITTTTSPTGQSSAILSTKLVSTCEAQAVSKRPFLLALPLELRLQIYAYLLTYPSTNTPITSASKTTSSQIHPSILLVCQQLLHEALPILYTTNIFLAHPSLLTSFPRLRPHLPPICRTTHLPLIRRVHLAIRLETDPLFSHEDAKTALTGMEEVVVELTQGYFLGAGCQNLRRLEGVRGVKRVRFCGSTLGFERYLSWLRGVMMGPEGSEVMAFEAEEECRWVDQFIKCNRLVVA